MFMLTYGRVDSVSRVRFDHGSLCAEFMALMLHGERQGCLVEGANRHCKGVGVDLAAQVEFILDLTSHYHPMFTSMPNYA